MLPILFAAFGAFPAADCLTNYGQTACGYHCIANYGQVRCAQTPFGACLANYGQVRCWDPPRWVIRAHRGRPPQAECLANYGQVACGYHCVANYGQVRCAVSPQGQCQAASGTVQCFDPRPW